MTTNNNLTGLEIAIIGMAGRFPGAHNLEKFWKNLKNGVESISFFSTQELEKVGISRERPENPGYIKAKAILENIEFFDSNFFDYSPKEAEIMDPQMRIFHEITWEALEDAGYGPGVFKGAIGLYAGAAHNHYWIGLSTLSGKTADIGNWAANQLIDKGYLAMRISYKLNLKGPSYTIYTACSTSLVAVHLACQAILGGECDMALAGGITLMLPQQMGYLYQEGMIMSPDGHCRAFDTHGAGTVSGEGAGIVVLKRLEDAMTVRDHIYAVIKGTAINNDGIRKSGFTAPSVEGQVEAIRAAQQMAHVEPGSISYIEAHGTATTIGDPIEIEALTMAFNTGKKNYCAIGSVKSNIGHLDAAAGIAGFIKTVLALKHRMIPPSLHFTQSNPEIDFENSPFYVNTVLKEWNNHTYPLRAGVSSFGIGGTNAHVILEQTPISQSAARTAHGAKSQGRGEVSSPSREYQLILLSAKTPATLNKMTENLAEYLKNNQGIDFADAAYTLQAGREAFKHRKMAVASDTNDAVRLLESSHDPSSPGVGSVHTGTARDTNRLVFMFSGQGSQYVNMGLDLYRTERVFREEMDHCFEILKPLMDYDIKEILYPSLSVYSVSSVAKNIEQSPLERGGPEGRGVSKKINQTEITQPLLFAFEYALAKLLMKWGIKPYAMIGHSIGEYVAACLAGVFSLEDGLRMTALRGKLMHQMPTGTMLSVSLPGEELKPLLRENRELALAAVNTPSLCVVSGPDGAVKAFENQLKTKGHDCRLLHTSHAFHSPMMDPVLKPFEEIVRKITLNKPKIPYISNVTGQWITFAEAMDPTYWAKHLRSTIRFSDGFTLLLEKPNTVFIELGPGRSLATFVKQHGGTDTDAGTNPNTGKKTNQKVINLVKHPKEEISDSYYLLNKIGQLWLYGEEIDWSAFYLGEERQRLSLPTYPFERRRYWPEVEPSAISIGMVSAGPGLKKRSNITDWFYSPSWKRSLIPPQKPAETPPHFNWLVFMDEQGLGDQLLEQLKQASPDENESVVKVRAGDAFSHPENNVYTVNPRQVDDYHALITTLKKQNNIPNRIIHLWNVTEELQEKSGIAWDESYEDRGFYSLIYLAQAIGKEEVEEKIKITVVTNHMQEVSGGENLCLRKATVLGPVGVIPQEYQNLSCCCVDVVLPGSDSKDKEKLLDRLLAECKAGPSNNGSGDIIAYRNNYRWVQSFDPLPLPESKEELPLLKEGGIYIITGGLGGIGLVLAQYLAKAVKARLILTSRSPLPKREEWENWLNSHPPEDNISRKIRKIKELEKTGAQVMVFDADVSDFKRMQAVIAEAEEKLGTVNGVIHAAGIPGGGLIQMKTREQAENVLSAKVKGTLVLDRLLDNHPLDFFILCSSINSILPFLGQVDYYAANAFLDAFAYYKTSNDRTFTVSVNWDTWQEVGMTANAAKQFRGSSSPEKSQYREISYPLFDHRTHKDHRKEIYTTHFALNKQWVLDEHKVTDSGKGLVPGVTYLEMARQAFEENGGNGSGAIEISEIYFLNPLMVGENEERETRFILGKKTEAESCDFLVQSRTQSKDDDWQRHAVGKITAVEMEEEPVIHEIKQIEAKCNQKEIVFSEKEQKLQQGLLHFGPRWGSIQRVRQGDNQGLAFMQLSDEFTRDLDFYKLHPALLDTATGFLFKYIYPDSAYIPFAYKKLTIKGPLPAKVLSYSRLIEDDDDSQQTSLKFDVTIMDEHGKELVDIKEFTLLEVSEEVKGKIKEKGEISLGSFPVSGHSDLNLDVGAQDETDQQSEILKNGILPSEGLEVFRRILYGALPQVVVSTIDLPARIKSNQASSSGLLVEEISKRKPSGPKDVRPEISSIYVAPRTEQEQIIADIWQELLGIDKVGIQDDFFELGGDSLNIVQLNGLLKKALKRDIPVAVLFRHLTIHSFVQYLDREESGNTASIPKANRSQVINESKTRLKTRISRRSTIHRR